VFYFIFAKGKLCFSVSIYFLARGNQLVFLANQISFLELPAARK